MNRNTLHHHQSPGFGPGRVTRPAPAVVKPALRVMYGGYKCSVLLIAGRAKGRSMHEWQLSYDAKHWHSLAPTMLAKKLVRLLPQGATVYFRHRSVNDAGAQEEWCEAVSIVVV